MTAWICFKRCEVWGNAVTANVMTAGSREEPAVFAREVIRLGPQKRGESDVGNQPILFLSSRSSVTACPISAFWRSGSSAISRSMVNGPV